MCKTFSSGNPIPETKVGAAANAPPPARHPAARRASRLGVSPGSLVRFSFRVKKTTIRRRPRFPISSSVGGRRRSCRPRERRQLGASRGRVALLLPLPTSTPRGRTDAALRWSSRGTGAYLDVQESIPRRRQGMKSERRAAPRLDFGLYRTSC